MERRVLLAITLSFVVLFAFQALFVPTPPPANATATTLATPTPAPGIATPETSAPASAAALTTAAAPLVGDTAEREVTIETQKVKAVFSNRGGRLRHWILKEYKRDSGEPLDLIPETIPADLPWPFSLRVDDAQATASLNESLYRWSGGEATTIDATSNSASITFELETNEGLRARKTFIRRSHGIKTCIMMGKVQRTSWPWASR